MSKHDQAGPTIVGLGETLWDVFPDGARFGGAPANFACSVAALLQGEGRTAMVSGVGKDELGRRAIATLQEHGVDTNDVAQSDHSTGQVLVRIDPQGQASYEFASDTAWDNLAWTSGLEQLASQSSAVCFGTLAQRTAASREVVRRFVRESARDCLRVLDVNLRDPFWNNETLMQSLSLANVLKCNENELPTLAELHGMKGDEQSLMQQLAQRYRYRMTALTCGARGSILLDELGNRSHREAMDTTVVDTVGAGDSFTATIVIGMLKQLPIGVMHDWANRVSAFVCSQPGATPTLAETLKQP